MDGPDVTSYLADQHVRLVKVSAKEFRSLARDVLDLDAHLLALPRGLDLLVITLDRSHDSQFNKL